MPPPGVGRLPMRTFTSLCVLAISGVWAWADGNSSLASANASASIWPPITLTKTHDLWFGEVILEPGYAGRKIEHNAAKGGGTREPDGPGMLSVQNRYERWHNAEFEITGAPYAGFSLVLPHYNSVFITNTSTGSVIPIQLGVPQFDAYMPNAIGLDGKTKIWVGGIVLLPVDPVPGYYSGQFQITVAYN